MDQAEISTNMGQEDAMDTPTPHEFAPLNSVLGWFPLLQQDGAGLWLVTAPGAEQRHRNVTHGCLLEGSSPGNSMGHGTSLGFNSGRDGLENTPRFAPGLQKTHPGELKTSTLLGWS